MKRKVLDVGNCGPDFASISGFLTSRFDCELVQAHGLDDALAELKKNDYALALVNRKLDRDYSDGIEIIKAIKADSQLSGVPVMLVTNYAEHQDAAVKLGAERGFGKLEMDAATAERLAPLLD